MTNLESRIKRAPAHVFKKGETVYVIDGNEFDIYEAKITQINGDKYTIYYPDYELYEVIIDTRRLLPKNTKNNKEFKRQERIRLKKEKEQKQNQNVELDDDVEDRNSDNNSDNDDKNESDNDKNDNDNDKNDNDNDKSDNDSDSYGDNQRKKKISKVIKIKKDKKKNSYRMHIEFDIKFTFD